MALHFPHFRLVQRCSDKCSCMYGRVQRPKQVRIKFKKADISRGPHVNEIAVVLARVLPDSDSHSTNDASTPTNPSWVVGEQRTALGRTMVIHGRRWQLRASTTAKLFSVRRRGIFNVNSTRVVTWQPNATRRPPLAACCLPPCRVPPAPHHRPCFVTR